MLDTKALSVTQGSGNVFADLGLANPYYIQLKCDLILELQSVIIKGNLKPKDLGIRKEIFDRIISTKSKERDKLDIYLLVDLLDKQGYSVVASITKRDTHEI